MAGDFTMLDFDRILTGLAAGWTRRPGANPAPCHNRTFTDGSGRYA